MTTYERVAGGRVVETVTPVFGDHEDTRLGVAALDRAPGADGWRVEGVEDVVPAEPESTDTDTDTGAGAEDQGDDDPPTSKPPKPTAPKRNQTEE